MTENNIEPSDPLRQTFRSQSAVPRPRTTARSKYYDYLKKLQEKNKISKEYRDQHKSNDDYLKQRESGFQLYVNGVHNAPPRRASSAMRKRIDDSSNRTQTPAPFLSNFTSPTLSKTPHRSSSRRRHWTSTAQTTIKTDEGSILADINSQQKNEFDASQRQFPVTNNQITYRLKSSVSVDQSWMPDWFRNNNKSPVKSNEDESLSLSLDDIPTGTRQQTYRLPTAVGARLAGGDLMKNSSTHATGQRLYTSGASKTIDSLDLENFLQPKEIHIGSDSKDQKTSQPQQSSNKRNPFRDNASNDRPADWLERSITQIDLFSRRHRGMLENEQADEYLPSGAAKPDNENDEEQFSIPELPHGEQLVFNLKTTWGDRHYVGLNGIEMFSAEGHPIVIKKITADPPDINILPEYGNDPRVVKNLIDGVNKTRDDIHMWLAPFTTGKNHFIYITFEHPSSIAMIRIWNYNKNRIHSARGAKDVDILLDGRVIFKGEISQACGNIIATNDPSSYGETILFTTDDHILEKISAYDEMYVDQETTQDDDENMKTATNQSIMEGTDVRPMTRAMLRRPFTAMRSSASNQVAEFYGKKLILTITETWGYEDFCGLTGVEVVDVNDADCVIHSFDARPRDVTVLPDCKNDVQTLDKLFDGENLTCDDNHMWLCPFNKKDKVRIIITLSVSKKLHGLRIWNYNRSSEDTYRGVKRLHVQLNDKIISPRQGFLLRRAPGHCYFDFVQEIVFAHGKAMSEDDQRRKQNKETSVSNRDGASDISMPNGFIYEFQLHSTHGDAYYIGLNGLEFYDENGEQIGLVEQNIAACPHSVNTLNPGTDDDVRTPDKLIDGENNDADGTHSWVAPILPNVINRVFVIFDRPTSVSMIKIWNYAKTSDRGVREFSLLVDDLLVWTGILDRMSDNEKRKQQVPFNTILFSDETMLTDHEKQTVLENKSSFDNATDHISNKHEAVDYSKRPTTSVPRTQKKR
ncbi:unnamed protein product [Rotaria magnacalcarata]|uniref:KATNIP domain-containing protein n=1 Tax=Rotaria magnacalcarata TaxID=392030 RepID=A0A816H461_9BILA|nr:unnamed protein product [Rotaria magnacalcarata]CAF1683767.1 unnamed protein product [Rotaria magnacalcarata]CAF2043602.1 unnamed protein product [Rotaria magnacalcarata]